MVRGKPPLWLSDLEVLRDAVGEGYLWTQEKRGAALLSPEMTQAGLRVLKVVRVKWINVGN